MANKEKERRVLKHILHNNKYDVSTLNKPTKTRSKKENNWIQMGKVHLCRKKRPNSLLHYSKILMLILHSLHKTPSVNYCLLNHTQIGITLRNSGVYQLTCPDCKMKYVGQTGRSFRIRFSEHFRDFKYAHNKSKFAQHLLKNTHSIGPIENIMRMLYSTKKGKLMDTMEGFYIIKETSDNNQINDKNMAKPNIIFDTIVHEEASGAHTNR